MLLSFHNSNGQQNSPSVEYRWEKIEGNLRRANTETSVHFRRENTDCHVSCVICNMHFFELLSWLVEALLSTGPNPSTFKIFSYEKRFDTQYLLISAYSGPLWVIKKEQIVEKVRLE